MSLWSTIKTWLGKERQELREMRLDIESGIDGNLTQMEARLSETPVQAMERIQGEIREQSQLIRDMSDQIQK